MMKFDTAPPNSALQRRMALLDQALQRQNYAEAMTLIAELKPIADPCLAPLLSAAAELCACAQEVQSAVDWHYSALNDAESRLRAMDDRLSALVQQVTQSSSITSAVHRVNTPAGQSGDFWQSLVGVGGQEPAVNGASPEPGTADHRMTVYTLGAFQVFRDDQRVDNWGRKAALLFKFLLLHRGESIHKEVLMEQFWPGAEEDSQRNSLNVTVYALRSALRNGDPDFSHILYQNECYCLNPDLQIWTDYEAFIEHCNQARSRGGRISKAEARRAYLAAVQLFRGAFLPEDRYEDWLEPYRTRLSGMALEALDTLSAFYLEVADYGACISLCERMLSIEPWNEAAHLRLMRVYHAQGQPQLTLRQFQTCLRILHEEIGAEPGEEIMRFMQQIQNN